jgi:hypothetical protein
MPVKLSTSRDNIKKQNIWPIKIYGRTKMDDRPFVRSCGGRRNKKKKEKTTRLHYHGHFFDPIG